MSNDFRPTPAPKNAVDSAGLKVYGKKLEGGSGAPSLSFKVIEKGYVRIDVYANVDGMKKHGNIRQDLDVATFFELLELMERAKALEPNGRLQIDFQDYVWNGNKKSDTMMPTNKLLIGKNQSGMLYMSLINFDADLPKIQFLFDVPFRHTYLVNGKPMSPTEASALRFEGLLRGLYTMVPSTLPHVYKEQVKSGGNGFNGGNNRGQGQSRPAQNTSTEASAPAADNSYFDEDIPF